MRNLKLYCLINPFTCKLRITEHLNNTSEIVEIDYKGDLDSWHSFELSGRNLDLHILYEDALEISVYDIVEGETDTSKSHGVKTKIEY